MKIVIALGGSIVAPGQPDTDYIEKFSKFAQNLKKEKHKLMIVVGGGKAAKDYIKIARKYGANENFCDTLGIRLTRVNAMLLASAMGENSMDHIPEGFNDAKETDKIYVMGGTVPGHSTDAVAAMLARETNADLLIIATNVDGVYDKDPHTNTDARKFIRMSPEKLLEIVTIPDYSAGTTAVVDQKAAKIIHEDNRKTIVLMGNDLENMKDALDGRDFTGTTIE